MGLFSEGIPFFGKKKPTAPEAVQNGPTTPFSPTSMPAAEVNPVAETTMAPDAIASMPAPESPSVAPDLSSIGTAPLATDGTGVIPSPVNVEAAPASSEVVDNAGISDSAKDTAIGMAAMTNAYPGTVMQPPQETATPAPIDNKPAA